MSHCKLNPRICGNCCRKPRSQCNTTWGRRSTSSVTPTGTAGALQRARYAVVAGVLNPETGEDATQTGRYPVSDGAKPRPGRAQARRTEGEPRRRSRRK